MSLLSFANPFFAEDLIAQGNGIVGTDRGYSPSLLGEAIHTTDLRRLYVIAVPQLIAILPKA